MFDPNKIKRKISVNEFITWLRQLKIIRPKIILTLMITQKNSMKFDRWVKKHRISLPNSVIYDNNGGFWLILWLFMTFFKKTWTKFDYFTEK